MTKLEGFAHPRSVEEALAALAGAPGDARPIAGGTGLVPMADRRARVLVDLSRAGLDGIALDGDTVRLGATATLTAVVRARAVAEAGLDALLEAAGAAASRRLRNQITIGGNLVGLYPWSDPVPALLALGATARVRSAAGTRDVPLDELVAKHPSKLLQPGELVTEIRLPRAAAHTGSAFLKFARSAVDYALCDAAAWLRLDGKVIREARVAVGALRALPARLVAAEKALVGQAPDPATLVAAAAAGAAEAEVTADFRASVEYRRELCGVLVRRVLETAARRAAGRSA
jgi:carbon-monoxide dehydrogenase medium subunit